MISRKAKCVNVMREAARAFWYNEVQEMDLEYDEMILVTSSSSLFGEGMTETTETGHYRSVDSGHLHVQQGRVTSGIPLYFITNVQRLSETDRAGTPSEFARHVLSG